MAHPNDPSGISPAGTNEALTPVREAKRVFRWHDHAALGFSLGAAMGRVVRTSETTTLNAESAEHAEPG